MNFKIFPLLLIVLFASCSGTENPFDDDIIIRVPQAFGPNDTFNATVEDDSFDAVTFLGTEFEGSLVLEFNTADLDNITLIMPQNSPTGTFEIEGAGNPFFATYIDTDTGQFTSIDGVITISVHDTENDRIEATFSFIAEMGNDRVAISDGEFGVDY